MIAEVDAVLIASPGPAHDEQVHACLDRGVPVLCEKPLTTDIASAYRIVQKEAALGRSLIQVGFMRRFDAEYVALRKLITEGGLGNPLMLHCTHRNQMVGDHFTSEFMIRDSVVHEVDAARFLLDEELTSVQVIKGAATSVAPAGTADPMLVIFETESGRIVTDEIYVRTQVGYEVRTEVVGERGSATIGLDQNVQVKSADGRWGGRLTPSFVERFGAAYDLNCSAGSTLPGRAPSTVPEPGTGTRRWRSVMPACRRSAPVRRWRFTWSPDRAPSHPWPNSPGASPPPISRRPGHETCARSADVLLDQLGVRAA